MPSYFVTGTDTGVGKTLIACALLRAFAATGMSTVGMKPVVTGGDGSRWEDVEALRAAASVDAPRDLMNPYAFKPPIAPHIASELASEEIKVERIVAAHTRLGTIADVVIVEGAGGFMIPLNARQTSADLASALGAPVILVVGMRLGCLSHALLTRAAIESARLPCAGWIANCPVPEMPHLARNITSLEERLGCAFLGSVPYQPGVRSDQLRLDLRALLP